MGFTGLAMIMVFIVALTLVIVIYIRNNLNKGGTSDGLSAEEKKLWDKCRHSMNVSPHEVDAVIKRSLQVLKEKHPGKTEEWYLDKFLYDLQRDRS